MQQDDGLHYHNRDLWEAVDTKKLAAWAEYATDWHHFFEFQKQTYKDLAAALELNDFEGEYREPVDIIDVITDSIPFGITEMKKWAEDLIDLKPYIEEWRHEEIMVALQHIQALIFESESLLEKVKESTTENENVSSDKKRVFLKFQQEIDAQFDEIHKMYEKLMQLPHKDSSTLTNI